MNNNSASEIFNTFVNNDLCFWDDNVTAGTFDYCPRLRAMLNLPAEGLISHELMKNTFGSSFTESELMINDSDTTVMQVNDKGQNIWIEFKRLTIYTDDNGETHHSGVASKCSPQKADQIMLANGKRVNNIQKLLKGLQNMVSTERGKYNLHSYLAEINRQIGNLRVVALKWIGFEEFECIESSGEPIFLADGSKTKKGTKLRSSLLEHLCLTANTLSWNSINEINDAWNFGKTFLVRNNQVAIMASPIKLANGTVYGALAIVRDTPTKWTNFDRQWCEILGTGVGICIDLEITNNENDRQLQLNYIACRLTKMVTWIMDAKTFERSLYIYKDGTIQKIVQDKDTFLSRINPDDVELYKKNIDQLINGETDRFSIRLRLESLSQNEEIWYEFKAKVLEYGEDALPQTIIGTARDIQDQVENEAMSLQHMRISKQIFDTLPIGIEAYNEHGCLQYYNNAAESFYGSDKSKNHLAQQSNLFQHKYLSEADKMQIVQYNSTTFNIQLSNGTEDNNVLYEVHKLTHDGKLHGYLALVTKNDEKSTNMLEKTGIIDFTNRIRIGLYQNRGGIVNVNTAWNTNLGYETTKRGLRHVSEYTNIHPEDIEELGALFDKLIIGQTNQFDYSVRVSDGNFKRNNFKRWLKFIFVRNTENTIIGVSEDITERMETEEMLVEAREKAEKADLLKSQFVANISHEIRTPLNAVLGFSELTINAETVAERAEYAKMIDNNSNKLLKLVSDVMDYSEVVADTMNFNFSKVSPNSICMQLDSELKKENDKHNVTLLYQPLPQFTQMVHYTDELRTTQILRNMLMNALKFTNEGRVVFWYEVNEDSIIYHVTDTGIGISDEAKETIFEAFTKGDVFKQGTGLGLPLCRSIANKMGGSIDFTSTIGRGSHFTLTLPFITEEDFFSITETEKNSTEKDSTGGVKIHSIIEKILKRKKSVVVLENNQSTMMYLSQMMNKLDLIRSNAEGFITFWLEKRPPLTILDVRSCAANVLDIIKCIRSYDEKYKIVVLNTPVTGIKTQELLEAGANDVLNLPLNNEQVINVVSRYINL